jgi:tRNA A-37 threonylcarbamoyl transferase component Bud32
MRTRPLIVALIVTGTAAGVAGVRTVLGGRARAQAAVLDIALRQDASARDAQARREAEAQVAAAVQLPPLNAALQSRVDGATLVDLFDNEDWWRPFRAGFPLVQIVLGDKLLASRGPDIGRAADDLILVARRQQIGSAIVPIGDQTFVMSAGRLAPNPELAPVLLLGRPLAPPAAVAPFSGAGSHFGDRFPWSMILVVGLGGTALIVTRGRSTGQGAMPEPIFHRETAKLGTFISPPGSADAPVPGTVTALVRGRADRPKVPAGPVNALEAQPTPALPPKPGIGRYRLIDRLAEGGMAELFIAQTTGVEGFTRNFVLKRLRSDLVGDKQAVAQFIDEARMQAALVHSNIVPVFDFGVVDGEYFLTQEYIAGRDLAKLVHRHTQRIGEGLPEALAYYIAHETLQALSYAHEKHDPVGAPMGIVHRDISASNLMVSLQGEVKLSDFGIVKSNRGLSQTQAGTVKGNVYFMSPEQARGQTIDHRSDLFSLAHILHYCLTGRLLYAGENDLSVLYRAAKGPTAEDLAEIRKLSDPAGQILEKALAFEPADRFQSATEFADALPAQSGSARRATANLMQQLFGDEIRREATLAAAAV